MHLQSQGSLKNIPKTAYERMLQIMGEWDSYRNMRIFEKSRFKGFSPQNRRGIWRDGSYTFYPSFWAGNEFAKGDYSKIKQCRTALFAAGQTDLDAKEED